MNAILKFLNELVSSLASILEGSALCAVIAYVKNAFYEVANAVLDSATFNFLLSVFISIGLVLAVLYLTLDILEKASTSNISLDIIVLAFVKLVIATLLISNSALIFKGFNNAAYLIANRIVDLGSGDLATIPEIPMTDNGTPLADLFPNLLGFVGNLLIQVINLLCALIKEGPANFVLGIIHSILSALVLFFVLPFACLQRAMRLAINCLFAPFTFADVSGQGITQSKMIRFLYRIFNVCFGYVIIICGLKIVQILEINLIDSDAMLFGTGFSSIGIRFALLILACSVIFKAENLIRNLFE